MQSKRLRKSILPAVLSTAMVLTSVTPALAAQGKSSPSYPDAILDFSRAGYKWTPVDTDKDGNADYYQIKGVEFCANIVTQKYQNMNIYAPAAYFNTDGTINRSAVFKGYTAQSAPIVLQNNCSGWMSSTPGEVNESYINEGFVFVNCGARSRGDVNDDGTSDGKAPAPVVDLKSAVRDLRLNKNNIPGNTDNIISVGTSGGGQMSSILGASGNMDEYYAYLYENGAAGIEKVGGDYVSTIDDDIFASMCYCPIADLNNADMAYAWMRFDAGDKDVTPMFSPSKVTFSEFQLALQDDLADAYCRYINGLGIKDSNGNTLSFDTAGDKSDPRSGSYYNQILQNMSDALNAFVENQKFPYTVTKGFGPDAKKETYNTLEEFLATYGDTSNWLKKNADGTYSITDMAGFINGTKLVRNKDIPGFDTFWKTAENNAFGLYKEDAVHYSASVANVLAENYEKYSTLEGFEDQDVDSYIKDSKRKDIQKQTYLMNATDIMLNAADGKEEADIAPYWRTRNGTADEHTSFSIAYNVCMSAKAAGAKGVDYGLVWNMGHGDAEGTTTGTFVDWVKDIVPAKYADIDFSQYSGKWQKKDGYYYLPNVVYCTNVTEAETQCMDIYVPEVYVTEKDGKITVNPEGQIKNYTAQTAPIIYENGSGAYASAKPTDAAGKRLDIAGYIGAGFVIAAPGCRGTTSNGDTSVDGTAPASQTDLKAGIRYLKAFDAVIAGDSNKIISVGTSSGGAQSALLGTTGNAPKYNKYLKEIGAIMESTDNVYAAQCYCPIIDLEHANEAYEWMFQKDDSAFGGAGTPEGTFTDFQKNLSAKLAENYVDYVNNLGLKDADGALTLDRNGYSGTLFNAMIRDMEASATKFLSGLADGSIELKDTDTGKQITPEAYIKGGLNYKDGQGGNLNYNKNDQNDKTGNGNKSRDLSTWLSWDGKKATIDSSKFDLFVTEFANKQSGRMKACPSFDVFSRGSRENKLFGTTNDTGKVDNPMSGIRINGANFDIDTYNALKELQDAGYTEATTVNGKTENSVTLSDLISQYSEANSKSVSEKVFIMNPMNFIADSTKSGVNAEYFRIRTGAMDADTSYLISKNLALKLAAEDKSANVDFAYVWNLGHTNADYAGEFIDYVKDITGGKTAKAALTIAIQNAKALSQNDYTASSWAKVQNALKTAEKIAADINATQKAVDKAFSDLNTAVKGLVKMKASTITLKNKTAKYTGKAISIGKAAVKGSTGKVTYTYYSDKACRKALKTAPKSAGTYYVKAAVAADANYKAATSNVAKLTIQKAAQKIKVQVTSKNISKAKVKKAKQTFSIKASAKGKLSYKKVSGSKKLSISKTSGKITVKKGTAKGTYKIKVKVSAKATGNYASASTTKTITVKVK